MGRVHFIGIGGAGLSAIALVLLERGQAVSGSDRLDSPILRTLEQAGAQVYIQHHPEQVAGARLVVRSSAVMDDNPEVVAAQQAGIPVLKREDYLQELLSGYTVIAVAGTHGKTTTTAMLAWVLTVLGVDPSYIIGSTAANLGSNAHAGGGKHFVIEADEYDHMFHGLSPYIAIITNVEHDHPDCYPTPQDFQAAFVQFAEKVSKDGVVIGCKNDPGARQLLKQIQSRGWQVQGYGLEPREDGHSADYFARDLNLNRLGGYDFKFCRAELELASLSLQVPGKHNVRNALATMVAVDKLHLDMIVAAKALNEFRGVARRFEVVGERKGVTYINDYAHHPTEIRATLAAVRDRFPNQAVWAVWQPHTFSRTRALQAEFGASFVDADHVVVLEIYPAREAPPEDGFSSQQVMAAVQHPDCQYAPDLLRAEEILNSQVTAPAAVLVLSAGDADVLIKRLFSSKPHG